MDTKAEAQGGAQSDSGPPATPPGEQPQESPAQRAIRASEEATARVRAAYPFGGGRPTELDRRTESAFHFSGMRDRREGLPALRGVRAALAGEPQDTVRREHAMGESGEPAPGRLARL